MSNWKPVERLITDSWDPLVLIQKGPKPQHEQLGEKGSLLKVYMNMFLAQIVHVRWPSGQCIGSTTSFKKILQYTKTTLYDRKQNVVKVWTCHRNLYVIRVAPVVVTWHDYLVHLYHHLPCIYNSMVIQGNRVMSQPELLMLIKLPCIDNSMVIQGNRVMSQPELLMLIKLPCIDNSMVIQMYKVIVSCHNHGCYSYYI
jgi:hypothetical protein